MSATPLQVPNEQLVAYLDGELEAADRQALEARLSTDAQLRARLAELDQTWHLLDQLPRAGGSDRFAETTVSLAALAAERRGRPGSRWRAWALAALAGFLVVGLPLHFRRQQQVRDLPVIQNLELYRVAESVEFLRMLQEEGLFLEDVDDVL